MDVLGTSGNSFRRAFHLGFSAIRQTRLGCSSIGGILTDSEKSY